MNHQFDPFRHIVDSARNLCAVALSSYEELSSLHLEQAEEALSRHGKHWRNAMPVSSDLGAPDAWPAAIKKNLLDSGAVIGEAVASAIDYQKASLRVLQSLATETQQLLAESVSQQVAALDPNAKQGGKRAAQAVAA